MVDNKCRARDNYCPPAESGRDAPDSILALPQIFLSISSMKLPSLFFMIALAATTAAAGPVRIIFDTDITGDVDDVLALAMCHTLADRGACELLGVTISKDNPLSASFVDAQNTFYGRPDLPIGVTRDPAAQKRESRFLKLAGSTDYPHDLLRNNDALEAIVQLTVQPPRSSGD